jgi:hypothetical protein
MSLINDALKRAKEAQGKNPPQQSPSTPGGGPPFKESEPPPPSSRAPLFAGVVIAFLLLVLVWAYVTSPSRHPAEAATAHLHPQEQMETLELNSGDPGLAFDTTASRLHQITAGKEAPRIPAAFLALPEMPAPEPSSSVAEPSEARPEARSEESSAAARVALDAAASEAPVTPAGRRDASLFPEVKLQAIHFRLKKPSVMANGRTLYVGDSVEGAKVVDIQRQEVLFEYGGRTNSFRLGE